MQIVSSTDVLFFYGIWMDINIRNKTFTDLVEQFPQHTTYNRLYTKIIVTKKFYKMKALLIGN